MVVFGSHPRYWSYVTVPNDIFSFCLTLQAGADLSYARNVALWETLPRGHSEIRHEDAIATSKFKGFTGLLIGWFGWRHHLASIRVGHMVLIEGFIS